uniref:F-box domain-containing protein n=1 Tax=Graphocephala atropunctata TaxID=36148 RepID=A0A1B6K8Y0_9HEMI
MGDEKPVELYLGEYITNEYGLLKQVLSFLNPNDLWNAKQVCRKWKAAVELLIDKNPRVLNCPTNGEILPSVVPKPILPAVIIHQDLDRYSKKKENYCEKCKKFFYLCPCAISTSASVYISLSAERYRVIEPPNSFYKFWQTYSALVLPSSQEINVSTFCIKKTASILKEPLKDETVTRCLGGEDPIKCLLIIARRGSPKWISPLLNQIVARQGKTFAVGGGEILNCQCKAGNSLVPVSAKRTKPWFPLGYLFIAFRGEGVTAHSKILDDFSEDKINASMKELADRVGPVPEGGSRIAFLAQCVARTSNQLETLESSAFDKAFPSVPQFGFHAYGEYGMTSSSTGEPKRRDTSKKMKITFDHSNTTSITILTFNKIKVVK